MKKNLLVIFLSVSSLMSYSQFQGNLLSINPNSGMQGQTLITTITTPGNYYLVSSPPCDNQGIFLLQGTDSIFASSYNFYWPDQFEVEFTIPAAAPIGFYDVYLIGSYYDWWGCTPYGYWMLSGGFEVTMGTEVKDPDGGPAQGIQISPNPLSEKSVLAFSNPERMKYRLAVMNSMGKTVYIRVTDGSRMELNRKDFEAGIYYYRLDGLENNYSAAGKFSAAD